jgi:hypothetical protein
MQPVFQQPQSLARDQPLRPLCPDLHSLRQPPSQLLRLCQARLTLGRQPGILDAQLLVVHQVQALSRQVVCRLEPPLRSSHPVHQSRVRRSQRTHLGSLARLRAYKVLHRCGRDCRLDLPFTGCLGGGCRHVPDEQQQRVTSGLSVGCRGCQLSLFRLQRGLCSRSSLCLLTEKLVQLSKCKEVALLRLVRRLPAGVLHAFAAALGRSVLKLH